MARPLAALERFFERLFERPAARLFRTSIQPVQLERRIERAMEAERHLGAQRTYVPDRYRVQLDPADLAGFAGYQATLEAELSAAVLDRARRRGYSLAEAPRVTLHANDGVPRGDIVVLTGRRDPLDARPAPDGFARLDVATGPDGLAAPVGPAGRERTAAFSLTEAPVPAVALHIEVPGQPARLIPVHTGSLSIGRGQDNDLILADERVSRRHGRLAVRRGALVYDDLDSTNGSFVNGRRVHQVVLGLSDELRLGGCRLTVLAEGATTWTP
ncbi:MAG: FhaA domain-containing protein [Candidatus Limnocylindrales bacterium]